MTTLMLLNASQTMIALIQMPFCLNNMPYYMMGRSFMIVSLESKA